MSFGQHRITLTPGVWTKISTDQDANVTIDNYGVGAYQFVQIVSGPHAPDDSEPLHNFRTLRPGAQHALTNLDEGTVLWARAVNEPVVIEVLTG
jgi:hypothetical protein